MSTMTLTKQYIFDDAGDPIAVLLPIAEYYKLIKPVLTQEVSQLDKITGQQKQPDHPLYGALRHLGGSVASTEELDETRRELWAAWDREELS